MANWLGNSVDWLGTFANLPDFGVSEWLAGGNKTDNTGRIPITPIFGQTQGSATKAQTQGGVSAVGKKPTSVTARPASNTGGVGNISQPANNAGNYYANQSYGVGGSYAPAAPAYDPNEVARYDQAIAQINQAKNRLGTQLGIAKQNIGDQYNTNLNELKSVYNRANRDYDQSTTQNSQNLRTNTNNINDKASIGMRGLQRLLGSYGAVGSDMGVASDAVTDVATAERSGANSTFANNQRGLDTNWFDFQEQDKNSRQKLNDWRTRSVRTAEQQSKQTEQDLLTQLARLQGERAQVTGGSFAGASQSAIDQANRLGSQIDQLGRFKPTYDGRTPVYQQRALDSYTNDSDATIATSALPGGIQNRYLSMLLGEDEEERLF